MAALLYTSLVFCIFCVELFRNKKHKIDCFTLFNLFFLLSYAIPSLLWSILDENFFHGSPYILNYNASLKEEIYIIIPSSYLLFSISYFISKRIKTPTVTIVQLYDNNKTMRRLITSFLIFSFFIIIGITLTGGVTEYISLSLRGRYYKEEFGLAGYLNYFLSASTFIFIGIYYTYYVRKHIDLKAINKFILLIIIYLISIYFLSRGSRSSLVYLLIYTFLIHYYLSEKKISLKSIGLLSLITAFSFAIASLFRPISRNITSGETILHNIDYISVLINFRESLLAPFNYFKHYFYTIVEFLKNGEIYYYPRLGIDILSGLILTIPGISTESVGLPPFPDIINQDVFGYYQGNIPPGWIAWSLIDGHVFYLAGKIIISAFICSFLDRAFFYHSPQRVFTKYAFFILIVTVVEFLFVGTAMNLFRSKIGIFIFILFVFFAPFLRVFKVTLIRQHRS